MNNIMILINSDNGDGILVYCTKNLCPLLGDHRYSSRVQQILGKPVLNLKNAMPKTQVSFIFILRKFFFD
jgi:hypothetical protein